MTNSLSLFFIFCASSAHSGLISPFLVRAGGDHTCALDAEGVKCWGYNVYGQTNVPSFKNSPNATTLHWVPNLKNDSPEELKIRLNIPMQTKKILVNIKGISENNSYVSWNSEVEINNK